MVIAVLADEKQQAAIRSRGFAASAEILWADSLRAMGIMEADVYIDLLFHYDSGRIAALRRFLPKPVIVQSVEHSLSFIGEPFIRICAWPALLEFGVVELAVANPSREKEVQEIMSVIGCPCRLVPDRPGMIGPRLLALFVNEAWYALGSGVGTREEIESVMKPYAASGLGPFEWGDRIGLKPVVSLLEALAREEERYAVAPALQRAVEGPIPHQGSDSENNSNDSCV